MIIGSQSQILLKILLKMRIQFLIVQGTIGSSWMGGGGYGPIFQTGGYNPSTFLTVHSKDQRFYF